MLRAVLFDMDGTLLDSEVVHQKVIHEIILRLFGYDQPAGEYMQYCGVPDSQMWPAIIRDLEERGIFPCGNLSGESLPGWNASEEIPSDGAEFKERPSGEDLSGDHSFAGDMSEGEKLSSAAAEMERLHWIEYDQYMEKNGISPFPGVPELLASLKKEGLRTGIGTGSLRRVVEHNLEEMGLTEYIDAVATSEDCENGKPAPDVYLEAARRLGVAPGDCLVIEDARNGLLSAEAAGMCRAAFDGSQLPSDVEEAPVVFSDYRDVTPAVLRAWYEEQIREREL